MLVVLNVVIYSVVVIIALLLIALILVQPAKSGGFGSAFGGVGESVFGAQAMSHLSKVTVVLVTLFFVLTLLLAIVSGHQDKLKGSEKSLITEEQQEAFDDSAKAGINTDDSLFSVEPTEDAPINPESVSE